MVKRVGNVVTDEALDRVDDDDEEFDHETVAQQRKMYLDNMFEGREPKLTLAYLLYYDDSKSTDPKWPWFTAPKTSDLVENEVVKFVDEFAKTFNSELYNKARKRVACINGLPPGNLQSTLFMTPNFSIHDPLALNYDTFLVTDFDAFYNEAVADFIVSHACLEKSWTAYVFLSDSNHRTAFKTEMEKRATGCKTGDMFVILPQDIVHGLNCLIVTNAERITKNSRRDNCVLDKENLFWRVLGTLLNEVDTTRVFLVIVDSKLEQIARNFKLLKTCIRQRQQHRVREVTMVLVFPKARSLLKDISIADFGMDFFISLGM